MNKQLLLIAEVVSNEKGVEKSVVLDAIQAALESATRKGIDLEDVDVRVELDPNTGEYKTFRCWHVVEEEDLIAPNRELTLEEAKERDENAVIGSVIEMPIESVAFGRITAQAAKQVIVQKVREAERELVVKQYEQRVGELVTGIVKKTTRDYLFVDLGANAEAMLPRSEMLPREVYRPGERVRAYLYEVSSQVRGPQLFLSRTRPEMLMELFRIEVPEIGEDVIDMMGAAREPGVRAKVMVKTNDGRIDPVGACVGMRGSRVQAVSGELGGERVDIILWDENPAQLVINALSPAEVSAIVVDEETHSMDVSVAEEFLSQAIGRSGQNVKLASELTGWRLNVMSEADFAEKGEKEAAKYLNVFTDQLDVDEEVAQILVDAGFTSLEEVAYVPASELLEIDAFDEELVEELRNRANDALLTRALTSEEQLGEAEPAEDLLNLEGMERHLAYVLANRGIITQEDLAEQSVDELLDIEGMDEDKAAKLIMKAREPWFASSEG